MALLALATLAACGGGGDSSVFLPGGGSGSRASPNGSGTGGDGWVAGVYQPESRYQDRCASPRTGTDPVTGQAYPDVQGTTLDENFWLRSWTNDLYLWYAEVPDIDPGTYSSPAAYFAVLKTSATTSTGHPKDRFHFTMPTSQWEQFAQNGVNVGYGVTWALISSTPPREVYAGYVWPGGAAAAAGLVRGTQILAIDGVDMVNAEDPASLDSLNEGLSPAASGESHTFTVQDPGSSTTRTVTLRAAQVSETPVAVVSTIPTPAGPVGYVLFNDIIATSEQELIDAINTLKRASVTDLVLDLRYDGGGYLDIASELAYMIAGPGPTQGRYFDRETFNDKHPTTDPVTGEPISPTPFHTTAQGFSTTSGTPLPYLGLSRVYVLTGPDTCSASEAIVNGLTGVGVQVIQIGSTTCGKPYGFYPQDDCGTTYFSIEFQGNNAAGFGDYPDGFSPQNSPDQTSAVLPGCSVADDFSHALGDASEGRLATALAYRAGAACPAPSGTGPLTITAMSRHLAVHRALWRQMRILRRPR